ncbi:hypothetical protein [Alteribacillus iranensis]|uniref:Uncharacterized protein n=1 Tax=Alteribacillus iranensis TaxID=930128 RepID=A0A1I2E2N2_9BACI|nr:hypothetical protein [Alteribacillus iranensis]SFE86893.1 hypothetical protein SAMN05192532_10551 [Alteribacillus iranensis]
MKFKKGDLVQVKPDLVVNVNYYNEGNGTSDVFSHRMMKHRGRTAIIEEVNLYGYTLSIDRMHTYTDEMLQYPEETLDQLPYHYHPEVEQLIEHVKREGYRKLFDKALKERLYETDPETFQEIYELYRKKVKN